MKCISAKKGLKRNGRLKKGHRWARVGCIVTTSSSGTKRRRKRRNSK